MGNGRSLSDIRRDYGQLSLNEENAAHCPIEQFRSWFAEVSHTEKNDPTAMVLATVDEQGYPDTRVVLLKGIEHGSFVFYTNYESTKSIQMRMTPYVALNFYWPEMARQVRIRGVVKRVSEAQSDVYFSSRPLGSQLSAVLSKQSSEIEGREALDQAFNALIERYQQELVMRPAHWGGYAVTPDEVEFWQGRDNRMHDRLHYCRQADDRWIRRRLAP